MVAFHGFESFIRMGGYGAYVWPAFAIGFVFLFGNYMFIRSQFRRSKKQIRKGRDKIAHENSA